jgi:hypothetical protein
VDEFVDFETARQQAMLTFDDLWIRYLALGGYASQAEIKDYVEGSSDPSNQDYDLLAQALNEKFMDLGMDCPVPYSHP